MKSSVLKKLLIASVLPLAIACEEVEYVAPTGVSTTRFANQTTPSEAVTPDIPVAIPVNRPSTGLEDALRERGGYHGKIMVEDLFPGDEGTDYDYDDMIIEFRIQPVSVGDDMNQVDRLVLDFAPHPHSAWFSSKITLDLSTRASQLLNGKVVARIQQYNENKELIHEEEFENLGEITLFEDTLQASRKVTDLDNDPTLSDDPMISTKVTLMAVSEDVDNSRDKVMKNMLNRISMNFYVRDTREGKSNGLVPFPLSTHKRPYLDGNGMPPTIMVPLGWRPMRPGQSINEAYPGFVNFIGWLGGQALAEGSAMSRISTWFNSKDEVTTKLTDEPTEPKILDVAPVVFK